VAPGVRLEEDVLALMGFKPIVSENLRFMDEKIFRSGPMGLNSAL
jgi:propionate CoA-transferase